MTGLKIKEYTLKEKKILDTETSRHFNWRILKCFSSEISKCKKAPECFKRLSLADWFHFGVSLLSSVSLSFLSLPKFSVFLFGRNFDDSRFVDDPGSAVALLDDPDDPCLVSFLFLNVLKIIFHFK